MVTPRRVRTRGPAWILFTLGLVGTAALVVLFGADDVLEAIARVGWGIALVAAWRVIPLVFATLGWAALLPRSNRRRLASLFMYRWIAESVNNLLPVAQVGGDILRARLATLGGVPAVSSSAAVVADITAGLLTQVIFAFGGLALLLASGEISVGRLLGLCVGLLFLIGMLAGFAWFQRTRYFRRIIERVAGILGHREGAGDAAAALEAAIAGLYTTRGSFMTCCGYRLLAWVLGAIEVWIALRSMGMQVGLGHAVILESLGQAARTAGFIVPGALGVQEGSYVFLGSLTGLSPGASLALSLVKRAREIITGVPGLAAWHIAEASLRAASGAERNGERDARSPGATRA